MTDSESFFTSSDTGRSAGLLKHAQSVTFEEPLKLELGGRVEKVHVVYETYGRLNDKRSNAVLICHALSGDSHVARHDDDDDPGWWDLVVGPGKAIDTDRYFVICPNILGGCRGTTGPGSVNPATGRPYGCDFPTITIADMVEVQRRLVDHLGIDRLLAVVGGSMGGHQVLSWACRYPSRAAGVIPIATSPRLSSQALAFDVVGRNAILRDPNFQNGQYYDQPAGPTVGLAIARMIGHITYLSPQAMREKFGSTRLQPRDVPVEFEKKFSVGSYLGYKGSEFVERFDANSYMTITMAMDLFDIGDSPAELARSFTDCDLRWLAISFTSDWLFSPEESARIVYALVRNHHGVSYCNVQSNCGHDAFLMPNELDRYGALIGDFLSDLSGVERTESQDEDDAPLKASPSSIFCPSRPRRLDYDRIVDLVPKGASVLDLGCGSGGLLSRLKKRGQGVLLGVELDEQSIIACVRRGLNVIQADLNKGLADLPDKHYDCVVLSHTLQAVRDVEGIIDGMLRVGRRCVVSFPNFAYHKLRSILAEQGRSPESSGLLKFKWYNSPNIRFFSIRDFEEFCAERNIRVHRCIALDTEAGREVSDDPNANADMAIFVISR